MFFPSVHTKFVQVSPVGKRDKKKILALGNIMDTTALYLASWLMAILQNALTHLKRTSFQSG